MISIKDSGKEEIKTAYFCNDQVQIILLLSVLVSKLRYKVPLCRM